MRLPALSLSVALLAMPLASMAQTTTYSPSQADLQVPAPAQTNRTLPTQIYPKKVARPIKPLSRLAVSGGVSAMGVNMQAATNVNRYLNVRGTGNFFNYTVNNISTNGFNLTGKVNMATAGASVDVYPFPNHGLRFSPGLMFYNQNQIAANAVMAGGTSFKLNNQTFYSASANTGTGATPITATASLGLNTNKQAFTMTTGWGNIVPRMGGHWSFPFELGAAFTGTPSLAMNLTGWACLDKAQTQCANLASTTNPIAIEVQTNKNTQLATWRNDLNPLKVYPILSFGVAYSFKIR